MNPKHEHSLYGFCNYWIEYFLEHGSFEPEVEESLESFGLLERADYDPKIHGEMECEPGDYIFIVTELGQSIRDRCNDTGD